MFRRPKLKAHLRADVAAPDLVVLRSEDGHEAFPGRLLPLLLPYLDGTRTEEEIAGALAGRAGALDVRFGLSLLEEKDYLAEGDVEPPEVGLGAFADAAGFAPEVLARGLRQTEVEVVALGATAPEPLAAMLEASGIRATSAADTESSGLLVVLAEDYLDPRLAEIDGRARISGRPWLLVRPVGAAAWIGPLLRPPETACWSCLAARLGANFPYRQLLGDVTGRLAPDAPLPRIAATEGVALGAATAQILRFLGGEAPLADRLVTIDLRTLASTEHRIVRRPHCPECGRPAPPADRLPAPFVLEPHEPARTADGGHRILPADETWKRLAHHVSPLTGLVAWVRDHGDIQFPRGYDAFRRGVPRAGAGAVRVQVADHVFPAADRREALRGGLRRKSAGKGLSADQARASALGEALERYSGIFQGHEPRITGRWADLGADAVDPAVYLGYSERQLRERERWNAAGEAYAWVPEPFDRGRAVEGSPLWSLTENRFKYLPTACCYFGVPLPEDHRFCRADSNGGSAGNCREEAVLQGFLELVERDAVAIWWYNRLRRPGVNVESFLRPELVALLDLYRELGRDVSVLDVTSDFGIPTFAALSHAAGPEKRDLLLGFGAHFDAGIALARALTEMNQFLPGLVHGRERRIVSGPVGEAPWLEPAPGALLRSAEYPAPLRRDLREAVLDCVELARKRGLETLVLDQTREEVGLAVVKVVVPGLRPFWPRFGPGRLYDVPVQMGWLAEARREEELNPVWLLI